MKSNRNGLSSSCCMTGILSGRGSGFSSIERSPPLPDPTHNRPGRNARLTEVKQPGRGRRDAFLHLLALDQSPGKESMLSCIEEEWRMSGLTLPPRDEEAIRTVPMLSALPGEAFSTLLAQSELRVLPRRTMLFEQDEPATAFYLVLDGWVKLFRWTPAGDEAIVGVFARGECVAEVPCLAGGTYPVSGETVSDARLVKVPAQR